MGKMTGDAPVAAVFLHRARRLNMIGLLLIGMMILSCAGLPLREARPSGVYHRVKSGETLFAIARAYQVDLQELAEINNINHADMIRLDSVIFVPDANRILDDIPVPVKQREPGQDPDMKEKPAKKEIAVNRAEIRKDGAVEGKRRPQPPAEAPVAEQQVLSRAAETAVPPRKGAGTPESAEKEAPPARPKAVVDKPEQIHFDKKRFIWPVKGTVVSPFGVQPNRMYNNGIRIAAQEGTPVQAAADGVVIFSSPLRDYGETIIIQHGELYATVYAHLGTRTVRGEAKVKKGDRIAFIGKPVAKEEAALHFEIRHNNKARNPLFFLP